ncbi:hypothetical protein ACO1O0_001542 [Amphichorda felina]
MASDLSKQALLQQRERSFQDHELLTDSAVAHSHRSRITKKPSRARWSCCRITLIICGVVVLLLATSGFFGYRKFSKPLDGQSPPWYPSPKGGTVEQWADSYKKAADLVSKMTLPEKVNLTTGTGWSMGLAVGNTGPAVNVGFPGLALQDGPLGVRKADNITAFPAGVTVGATWNRELMYERGKAHGLEARGKGVNVILGPSVGPLGRMPAGGRNWEGFGADPYLQGIACAETIRGIQDQHVMATIKHFIANEQEHFRQSWEWGLPNAMSSNVDDRTLHEIYAWPFANAIKAGVASVMCSYNQVNNSYACGNSKLLNGILKDEMGFQGFVMSDWLAQRSGVASALAGLDMSMPGDGLRWTDGDSLWGPKLSQAVLNGSLPIDRLNDMVTRIVAAWYQLGQDDEKLFDNKGPNFSSFTDEKMGVIAAGSPSKQTEVEVNHFVNVMDDHDEVSRKIAIEGTVLLKNDNILPISRNGEIGIEKKAVKGKLRVGIFGEDAGPGDGPNACKDRGCNQGTLGSGWGSGAVEFPYLITPAAALMEGFNPSHVEITKFLENEKKKLKKSGALEDRDICFVFANSDAGEGFVSWKDVAGDRPDIHLQKGGDDLILEVADNCGGGSGSTIVIVHAVGPVVVEKWIEHERIKGVFAAHLPGQESGNAIASLIFGDENPSGKLPYTVGKSLENYGEGGQVMYLPNGVVPQQDFDEGIFVDYRHFDKYEIDPRFPFGFGQSYTDFKIGDMEITGKKKKSALPEKRRPSGTTAPKFDEAIPPAEEALFPSEIRRLEKYVYPYIDSVDDIGSGEYPYPEGYDVEQPLSEAGGGEGGNPDLWETYVVVTVEVENTGRIGGMAVPQLYMSYPEASEADVEFPSRVLRGFEKLYLEKGEKRKVEFQLTRRDLSYWDVVRQNWVMLEEGEYVFAAGLDSRTFGAQGKW